MNARSGTLQYPRQPDDQGIVGRAFDGGSGHAHPETPFRIESHRFRAGSARRDPDAESDSRSGFLDQSSPDTECTGSGTDARFDDGFSKGMIRDGAFPRLVECASRIAFWSSMSVRNLASV